MASLLFPLAVLLTAISTPAIAAPAKSTDFIRRSCAVTLYPQLCYASLNPYATAVKQSPSILAVAATNVSLAEIKEATLKAAALRRNGAGSISAALNDCVDLLGTAADLTEESAAEILKLGPAGRAGGPSFSWEVSNAQTWMSAALTNEDTCVDGFQDVGGGGGATVKGFLKILGKVERFSSNALALINALVDG